jgi:hypothetical protein
MPTETCHYCGAPAEHETGRRVPMYRPGEWPPTSGGVFIPRCADCRRRQRRLAAGLTIAAVVATAAGIAALNYAVATTDSAAVGQERGGFLLAGNLCCLLPAAVFAAWATFAAWRRLTVGRHPEVRAKRSGGFGWGEAPKQE